jgi:zinc protease
MNPLAKIALCLLTFAAPASTRLTAAEKPAESATDQPGPAGGYAVVVSARTQADPEWRKVVDALREKHQATVLTYATAVTETLPKLRGQFPRHACFVATPSEAGEKFVAAVHQLTRQFDNDPYTDCLWGILTGYNAAAALRIAAHREPLTVRKVASGTEVALDLCEEGVWYCELKKNRMVKKEKGGEPVLSAGPDDTTEALVKLLNDYHADCFVTSGHATQRDWQIGFAYKNGYFRCQDGVLYGLDTKGRKFPVQSPNPKVYLPIGNCLMGNVDGPDAMALAFMNSAGVNQMMGYTVPTWYGYGGWGCLDYFIEQPGRYTFAEACFANHAALIHRLQPEFTEAGAKLSAQDQRGLLHDRDVVAFYGDPAWVARMAPGRTAWDQTLSTANGNYTFEIKPNLGAKTFAPVNKNGSQRGGRPIIQFLPEQLKDVKILEGVELNPVITDDFILVPNPTVCDPARKYRVVFSARPIQ